MPTHTDNEEKLQGGILFSKHTLWMNQIPSWNFELDEDELLERALEDGFVKKVGDDIYLVNNDYEPHEDN